MTCPHCGEELRRAFGQWLHTRESATLAGLLFCADGTRPEAPRSEEES